MKTSVASLLSFTLLLLFSSSIADFAPNPKEFVKCLRRFAVNPTSISNNTFTPQNASFTPILQFSIRNPRFNTTSAPKPSVIVTPVTESQVQTVLFCAKRYTMQIRVRSGGHDFEGLSFTSTSSVPFVLLDMINLRKVTVAEDKSYALVQTGATLGELYYYIYKASSTRSFPGGVWSTVGATGLICGGGYGVLRRKYGLGADNVLDARILDVHGRILNRKTMGEDLFWAIRGGGCNSFGILLSWKLRLVEVPKIVTTFNIFRTLEQNLTRVLYKFQTLAPNYTKDLDIRVRINTDLSPTSPRSDKKTVMAGFQGCYLGLIDGVLPLLQKTLPELRVTREELSEVSWIDAAMSFSFFNFFSDHPTPDDFLNRDFLADIPTKAKSDYVTEPISEKGLNGMWQKLLEVGPNETTVIFTPYGGRVNEIPESATPFPHRAVLFMIYYRVLWVGNTTQKLEWIRSLYQYMAPYVSKNPRQAYVNYDDLDLGVNPPTGPISYAQANKWGRHYFKNNFNRLVRVKTLVDPGNFFRNEQSIPPLSLFSDM